MNEDFVLCSANARNMKYYFNEDAYGILPKEIKEMLKIELVRYCSDAGGIIILYFDEGYRLHISTIDPIDEIGSELLIKRMREKNSGLFGQLEEFAALYAKF